MASIEKIPDRLAAVERLKQTYRSEAPHSRLPMEQPEHEGRLCPLDREALERLSIEGTVVDICPRCHGLWLDAGELRALLGSSVSALDQADKALLEQEIRDRGGAHGSDPPKRCPVCGIWMSKRHNPKAELDIDFCGRCYGIWLDGGEFAVLYFRTGEERPSREHLAKTVAHALDIVV